MTSLDRIDSESLQGLQHMRERFPGGLNAIPDLSARRAAATLAMTGGIDPAASWVGGQVRESHVPRVQGEGDIRIRIFTPATVRAPECRLLFIPGGGMVMGGLLEESAAAIALASELGIEVVALEYRLAPEFPYPAALSDCCAVLDSMTTGAPSGEAGRTRLLIYGGSAGGGLAIAMALHARDAGGPTIDYVLAAYPMLDDRHETPSSHEIIDVGIWDREGSIECWSYYLGEAEPDCYAAPARATDLGGLPPMFIDVGGQDLFRDEAIDFAQRATHAGVPVEFHLYPGAYHASEQIAPEASLSKTIMRNRLSALRGAIERA